jgi:hypothetical protein
MLATLAREFARSQEKIRGVASPRDRLRPRPLTEGLIGGAPSPRANVPRAVAVMRSMRTHPSSHARGSSASSNVHRGWQLDRAMLIAGRRVPPLHDDPPTNWEQEWSVPMAVWAAPDDDGKRRLDPWGRLRYLAAPPGRQRPGLPLVGAWLSLVERCVRDAKVGGSNPLAPTSFLADRGSGFGRSRSAVAVSRSPWCQSPGCQRSAGCQRSPGCQPHRAPARAAPSSRALRGPAARHSAEPSQRRRLREASASAIGSGRSAVKTMRACGRVCCSATMACADAGVA